MSLVSFFYRLFTPEQSPAQAHVGDERFDAYQIGLRDWYSSGLPYYWG